MTVILLLLVTFAAVAVMIWSADTVINSSITPQLGPVPATRPTRRAASRGQGRRPLGPEDDLEFMRELGRRLGHGDSSL